MTNERNGKHLKATQTQIAQMVDIVNAWSGKPSWQGIVDRIKRDLGLEVTRQTLSKKSGSFTPVLAAYQDKVAHEQSKKVGLKKPLSKGSFTPAKVAALEKRVQELEEQLVKEEALRNAQRRLFMNFQQNVVDYVAEADSIKAQYVPGFVPEALPLRKLMRPKPRLAGVKKKRK